MNRPAAETTQQQANEKPKTQQSAQSPDTDAGVDVSGSAQALLEIQDLDVEFATDRGWVRVVEDVNLTIRPREIVGLVGESGSGKSVTALSVLGLIPNPPGRITRGSINFQRRDLRLMKDRELSQVRGREIAMIFQEPMTSLNPAYTVGEQIAESVRWHRGASRRQAWERAVEMLGLVGIPSARKRARDYPHTFSGGMRQRVMIALALACDPRLVIADEPTTALDVTVQAEILELLSRMQEELDTAILFITHDLGVVADLCHRVVVMYGGKVVEKASSDPLFEQPLHPYTEGLLRSMPQSSDPSSELWSIPGVVPPPWAMPSGCAFHPRCESFEPGRCDVEPIPLLSRGGRQSRCIRVDELFLRGTS